LSADVMPLELPPDDYDLAFAVRTAYGELPGKGLPYWVAPLHER
jgi:hypothetical protein